MRLIFSPWTRWTKPSCFDASWFFSPVDFGKILCLLTALQWFSLWSCVAAFRRGRIAGECYREEPAWYHSCQAARRGRRGKMKMVKGTVPWPAVLCGPQAVRATNWPCAPVKWAALPVSFCSKAWVPSLRETVVIFASSRQGRHCWNM